MHNQILVALCTTLKARYYPPTIRDLRETLERSEDAEKTALDLSELIEQHGAHGWVEPLIEKAGPTILLQLEDLANLMETLKNYVQPTSFLTRGFVIWKANSNVSRADLPLSITASTNGALHVELPSP